MLERCRDAGRINAVVNHASVRPFVGDGTRYLDSADLLSDPDKNIFLMGEHGGFALIETEPKVHEIHTFILPEGRGSWARAAAQELIDFAAQNGDIRVWTKVPADQKNVELYTRRAGLRPTGELTTVFDKPYKVFSLELTPCP
jgi:hypothetical protein